MQLFLESESAQAVVEYALILGLAVIVCVAGLVQLGWNIRNLFYSDGGGLVKAFTK